MTSNDFYTNVAIRGNNVLVCGYRDGKRYREEVKYQPYHFIKTKEPSPYKNLQGDFVSKQIFPSIKKARAFIQNYKDVSNFDVYGFERYVYPYIFDNFQDCKPDLSHIKVLNIDIETNKEPDTGEYAKIDTVKGAISLIGCGYKEKRIIFGYGPYEPKEKRVIFIHCADEMDMLRKFLAFWKSEEYRPDIVTGWNIEKYDIPYIVNRIKKILGDDAAKQLSPWGVLQEKTIESRGKEYNIFIPVGVSVLDYFDLYKKFTQNQQESYTLDHIAFVETGKRKLDYSEYKSLDDLFENNYQKYVDYNIADIDRVFDIDKKKKLINLIISIAYDAKVNYIDALGSVLIWDVIIHNYLMKRNIVVPKNVPGEFIDIPGGYVKDPKPGLYEWVVSFDLQSLYPHLIMNFNISPETFVGIDDDWTIEKFERLLNRSFNVDDQYVLAANGARFRKDVPGFLPALMKEQFALRKQYKDEMIALEKKNLTLKDPEIDNQIDALYNAQWAKKIQLNSAYGALANKFFRYYSWQLASAVTLSGQLTVKWVHNALNKFLNEMFNTNDFDYIIAADTDSVYLKMDAIAKNMNGRSKNDIINTIDSVCKNTLSPFIEKTFKELSSYMNAGENHLFMKRESIAEKAIWRAAKHYIMYVWDSEGVRYNAAEIKAKGIETVKSTTPAVCKDALKKCIRIMMDGTNEELIAFVEKFSEEYRSLSFADISFSRGCNGLHKYATETEMVKSGTPIHVRGALVYNRLIKGHPELEPIYNGDKLKFCYLKVPNSIRQNVIAFPKHMPEELDLAKYIDYELMFQKSFLDPLNSILTVINWSYETKSSLEDFY